MEKFFSLVYRLRYIERWATSYCHVKENVAEHSFSVAIITYLLALYDVKINHSSINPHQAAVCALFHDSFECFSAHIVSPVKNSSGEAKCAFSQIRDTYSKRLLSSLPDEYQKFVEEDSFFVENDRVRELVGIADTIDAYIFCQFQIEHGNMDFKQKYSLMKGNICNLMKKERIVTFFFEQMCNMDKFEIIY